MARWLVYFLFLGAGFMMVEVALLQKFILLLGRPTLSLSLVLFSLLVASGAGSFLTRSTGSLQVARWVCLLIGGLVGLYGLFLPRVFNLFLGYSLVFRGLAAIGMILPLGFAMGIPFPMGIRLTSNLRREAIPWMWAVNGVASVFASVAVVALALRSGYSWGLIVGGICYFAVFVLASDSGLQTQDARLRSQGRTAWGLKSEERVKMNTAESQRTQRKTKLKA